MTESPLSSSPRRRRGAQPGNTNALKHGFYSRQFRPADLDDLDRRAGLDLMDEITLLRVYIRRLLEQSTGVDNFDDALDLLRVLSLASSSITRLLRVQKQLFMPQNPFLDLIQSVISDVTTEMGLVPPQSQPGRMDLPLSTIDPLPAEEGDLPLSADIPSITHP